MTQQKNANSKQKTQFAQLTGCFIRITILSTAKLSLAKLKIILFSNCHQWSFFIQLIKTLPLKEFQIVFSMKIVFGAIEKQDLISFSRTHIYLVHPFYYIYISTYKHVFGGSLRVINEILFKFVLYYFSFDILTNWIGIFQELIDLLWSQNNRITERQIDSRELNITFCLNNISGEVNIFVLFSIIHLSSLSQHMVNRKLGRICISFFLFFHVAILTIHYLFSATWATTFLVILIQIRNLIFWL